MADNILFAVQDNVATITLDRPEKLNAFTPEMLDRWVDLLDECRTRNDVRVVIVTGTGRAFTTGGDTSGFDASAGQTPAAMRQKLIDGAQRLPRLIRQIEKPVIAALNGLATGGGLDIALACDLRFAAASARFAETYARLGLVPGVGGAYLLPRVVGVAKALELLWTADFIDAAEAERIGLVTRTLSDDDLMPHVREFAGRIAQQAPLAVQTIKRLVYGGLAVDLAAGLEQAATSLPLVRASLDHREALAAIQEKRPATFVGE